MGLLNWMSSTLDTYTGLSPLSCLSILILMIITYKFVSSFFVDEISSSTPSQNGVVEMEKIIQQDMTREPVQLGRVSPAQLKAYDGSDPNKPLLMAIKAQIYDVSRGRMFYGPGGPYAMFAGHDATRALALMSFDPQDLTGDLEGLSEAELEVLSDWEAKFAEKYPKVGELVEDGEEEQQEKTTEKQNKGNDGGDEHVEDKKDV